MMWKLECMPGVILSAICCSVVVTGAAAQDAEEPSEAPPWSMADAYWGAEAMADARAGVQAANGGQMAYMVLADRLEFQSDAGEEALAWDINAWYGGDINKLYLKTEGDYSLSDDAFEEAELQLLWSRAVSSFWDVQAGLRYDVEPKGKTHAVIGVQGLAPYWFEIDAATFVGFDGDITARIEAEYEVLLNQRLVLQPRVELELSAQDIPELQLGSGVTSLDAGLRLRYEFKREFAPYIGAEWQKAFGETADFIRADNGDADEIVFVLGLRAWY